MREGDKTIAERVRDALAEVFGIRASDILGESQTRRLSTARLLGYYVLDKHSEMSFVEIGDFFGTRDRSTVQRGVARIALELKHDAHLLAQLDRVRLLVGIGTIPCTDFALTLIGGKAVDYLHPEDRLGFHACARPACGLPRFQHYQTAEDSQVAA